MSVEHGGGQRGLVSQRLRDRVEAALTALPAGERQRLHDDGAALDDDQVIALVAKALA